MSGAFYRAAWLFARPLAAALALGPGKIGRTVRGRRAAVRALREWAASSRDTSRPLVWFHAASVGEGRQAEPVIARLRALRPDWQIAYTCSSASAERFASTLPVDIAGFLPFDTADACAAALEALQPAALLFSATDVWPELVRQAASRSVPAGVFSATLAPTSSRRGWAARALLGDAYATLARVGAIDDADAAALRDVGVPAANVSVTGDTRHDAVAARVQAGGAARATLLAALRGEAPVLVAGSTWPADERVLLPAVARVRNGAPLRLVIAPHEPDARTLARLERAIDAAYRGLAVIRRLSDLERETGRGDTRTPLAFDVCVVDRVGVLFDLYAAATVAFVGGGFHRAGLHSVIEPAAHGVPVVFGSRWQSSRDARLLLEAGAAQSAANEAELTAALRTLALDAKTRATAGAAARAVVERGTGAADRSVQLVIELAERGAKD